MPTYVSLLRGINVSGRNRIAMADLRALLESAGQADVTTYVQSGNVISNSPLRNAGAVGREIEQVIARELGLDVTVMVRTESQLARLLTANPFTTRQPDPTKLHVTFLHDKPARAAVAAIDATKFAPDEFAVAGHDVYVHCPNGYGRTKINNTYFENKLGVAGTTRNWKTVMALSELAKVDPS